MIAEGLDVIDTHPTHDQAISGSRDNRINAALVSFTVNSFLVSAVIFNKKLLIEENGVEKSSHTS